MATEHKIEITKRDDITLQGLKQLRKNGNIPGIYYSSNSKESIPIFITKRNYTEAIKSGARVFNILVDNKKQNVLFKSVQYHPVTDHVIHVDFMRVRRSEKITISVPLTLVGKPIGVTEGGILSQAMNQIEISCYPTNVPDHLEVNIDHLGLNASISVADVNIDDEEIEIISAIDLNVASVIPPAAEEEVIISDDEESEEDAIDEESTEGTDEKTDDGENNSESTENQSKESN